MSFTTTMPNQPKTQTLLITVVAGAISSVAFGVSIFAMGILWLIPSVRPAVPNIPVRPKDKSRRRSAPPILQHHHPKPLVAEIQPSSASIQQNSPRRVYFLDSQLRPQRRYSDLSQLSTTQPDVTPLPSSALLPVQDDPESSPRSSSSTLVLLQEDASQESIESDSSSRMPPDSAPSRPSLSLKTHLPHKVKSGWTKKCPGSQAAGDSGAETTQSDDSTPSSSKPVRRSSLGFTAPWSHKNRRATVDLSSPPCASPTTPKSSLPMDSNQANLSSPSSVIPYFGRTPSLNDRRRRTSAPVRAPPPRTQPYAYPYFAAPPVAAQQRENMTSSEESVDKLEISKDGRTVEERRLADERRQQNAKAQSSLGHGRKPPQRRAVTDIISAV